MKQLFLSLLLLLPVAAVAQTGNGTPEKYLAGAVPLNEQGFVYFEKHYDAPGKSKAELYRALKAYTQQAVVEGPDHLDNARITEADSLDGIIAASIEEWLYFKKEAWVTHRTIFNYQLVFEISDGGFTASLRNLRYQYTQEETEGEKAVYRAENWITDDEALNKNKTKLTRIAGKFRKFTIDRKDALFEGAAKAAGLQ